jgi:aminoglycoside phosphotransferase (APT) family kinase protein
VREDGVSLTDLPDRLTAFLRRKLPEHPDIAIRDLAPVSGGNARRAWSFDIATGGFERACILLMQAEAGQLESDLAAEFQVISALHGTDVPAPEAYWIDPDGSQLGAPAIIMERVGGTTDILALRAPEPADRNRAVALAFADAAAALHTVHHGTAALAFLGETTPQSAAAEQIAYWESLFLKHRMEPHPAIVYAFGWLKDHQPVAERVSLVHGDFRLGNFLYDDTRITALLDWEMAHLGDPAEDVAWAYRTLWTPQMHLPLEDFVARYEAASGITLRWDNLLFYRLLGEIKHAVISITAARSFADRRTRNLRMADRMTMVAPCVQQFLDWMPAA